METPKVTPPILTPVTPKIAVPATVGTDPLGYSYSQKTVALKKQLFDYENEEQTNSLPDVLGKTIAKLTESGDIGLLMRAWNATNVLMGETQSLLMNGLIDPLTNDNYDLGTKAKLVLNNSFIGGVELLDVFANPIKGAIIEGFSGNNPFEGAWDAFVNRQNYDYDFEFGDSMARNTDEFMTEMLAEAVSDPLTFLTLGGTAIAKGVGKSIFKPMAKEFTEDMGAKAFKNLRKEFVQQFKGSAAETVEAMIKNKNYGRNVENLLRKVSVDDHAATILKSVSAMKSVVNSIDEPLSRVGIGLLTSGTWPALKYGYSSVKAFGAHRVADAASYGNLRNLEETTVFDFMENKGAILDELNAYNAVVASSDKLSEDIVDSILKDVVKRELRAWNGLLISAKKADDFGQPFIDSANALAASLSNNAYHTFPEYMQAHSALMNADFSSTTLRSFVSGLRHVEKLFDGASKYVDAYESVKSLERTLVDVKAPYQKLQSLKHFWKHNLLGGVELDVDSTADEAFSFLTALSIMNPNDLEVKAVVDMVPYVFARRHHSLMAAVREAGKHLDDVINAVDNHMIVYKSRPSTRLAETITGLNAQMTTARDSYEAVYDALETYKRDNALVFAPYEEAFNKLADERGAALFTEVPVIDNWFNQVMVDYADATYKLRELIEDPNVRTALAYTGSDHDRLLSEIRDIANKQYATKRTISPEDFRDAQAIVDFLDRVVDGVKTVQRDIMADNWYTEYSSVNLNHFVEFNTKTSKFLKDAMANLKPLMADTTDTAHDVILKLSEDSDELYEAIAALGEHSELDYIRELVTDRLGLLLDRTTSVTLDDESIANIIEEIRRAVFNSRESIKDMGIEATEKATLLQTLAPLEDLMERYISVRPVKVTKEEAIDWWLAQVPEDDKVYQATTSKLYNMLEIITTLQPTLRDIHEHGPLYRTLEILKASGDTQAHMLSIVLDGFVTFNNFLVKLESIDMPSIYKSKLLDTMTNYANLSRSGVPLYAGEQLDISTKYLSKIVDKTVEAIRASQSKYAHNLESFRAYLESVGDPDLEKFGMSHNAVADAYVTYKLYQYLGVEMDDRTVKIFADIETTGFNKAEHGILQLGTYNSQTGVAKQFVVRKPPGNVEPSNTVKELLYGSVSAYDDIYNSESDDALRAFFESEHIETEYFDTEAEALHAFREYVDVTKSPLDTQNLVFHNGNEFDIDFIVSRMRLNNVPLIDVAGAEDSLVLYRQANGVYLPTEQERQQMLGMLQDYVDERETEQGIMDWIDYVAANPMASFDDGDPSRFIPSFADNIRQQVDDISIAIDNWLVDNATSSGEVMQNVTQAQSALLELKQNMMTAFTSIKRANKGLHRVFITPEDGRYGKLLGDDYEEVYAGIPAELRSDSNIMAVMQADQTKVSAYGVRVYRDRELMQRYFGNTTDMPVLDRYITRLARKTKQLLNDIKNYTLLKDASQNDVTAKADLRHILEELQSYAESKGAQGLIMATGWALTNPNELELDELFALTRTIRNSVANDLNRIQHPVLSDAKLMSSNSQLVGLLTKLHGVALFREQPVIDPELNIRYFTFKHSEVGEQVRAYHNALRQADHHDVETLIKIQTEYGMDSAKAQMTVGLYDLVYDTLDTVTDRIALEEGDDGNIAKLCATLRTGFDRYHDDLSLNVMLEFVSQTPEEIVSRMYHDGYGFALINTKGIGAEHLNYIGTELASKVTRLNELGVTMHSADGWTALTLNKDMDYSKTLKPKYDKVVIPSEHITITDEITSQDLGQFMSDLERKTNNTLEGIRALAPDTNSSTLEKLDYQTLKGVYARLPKELHQYLWTLEELAARGMFNNGAFNHSVFGLVKQRRKLMEYAALNPLKNMYSAIQQIQARQTDQAKVVNVLMNKHNSINSNPIFKSDEAILETMIQGKGSVRLIYFAKDSKKGSVVKSIHTTSLKDVAFARSVDALLVTEHVYTKMTSIYNESRIDNPMLKWIEHSVIGPYKVGMLFLKEGLIIRNLIDSTLKNMVDTGDPTGILVHTLATAKNYIAFKRANLEITRLARANKSLVLKDAINEYFEQPNPAIARELYDMFYKFKVDGYSGGLGTELRNFYGDTVDKLYAKERIADIGIAPALFREFLHTELEPAKALIANKYPGDTVLLDHLTEIHNRFGYYKRAYQMTQLTHNKALDLETLVLYLQRPDIVDAKVAVEYNKLYEQTTDWRTVEDGTWFNKLMGAAPVRAFFDINSGLEEIFRLTNYTYHIMYDKLPEHEALHRVLKTHFDYSHKPDYMYYAEIIMPFANFRLNNLIFWMESFDNNPLYVKLLGEYLKTSMGFEDYTWEDRAYNKSLQYHLYEGNVNIYDNVVLKLSPSVLDTLELLGGTASTANALANSLVPPLRLVADQLIDHEYTQRDKESDDEYKERILDAMIGALPLVGPAYTGYKGNRTNYERNPEFKLGFMSSTFSMLKTQDKKFYMRMARTRRSRVRNNGYYTYLSVMRSANKAMRAVRRTKKFGQIGKVSKRGRSIAKLMLMPKNKYTYDMHRQLLLRSFNLSK